MSLSVYNCTSIGIPATPSLYCLPDKVGRGFTLIELMVAIAVVAILMTTGVPAFSSLIGNNRLAAQAADFQGSLGYARSEAIRRGQNVVVGASQPVTGNQFGGGWVMWVDSNSNGVLDAGEVTLKSHADLGGNTFKSSGTQTTVSFLPTGFLNAASTFTIKLCDNRTGAVGQMFTLLGSGMTDLNQSASCP